MHKRITIKYRVVIPAKAGIQSKYAVRSTRHLFVWSATHNMFVLDPGLRRDDETL
ncbi:hypothetical protein GCM10007901_25490 [Dyella acidisoli]|uniref:MBL fold metallo-hydrolase n=1 Tax=Dyella acidisoli TaxID=1867834 RepID=A0ABQ5XT23_9GAMM|nr:hypothetical protein GCM10007901_25490 [Dyella acidisoli]